MGAPSVPAGVTGGALGRPVPDEEYEAFLGHAAQWGLASGGHHNQNYVLPLTEPMARLLGRPPGTAVTVRVRRTDALPVVIRTWDNEARILRAITGVLPHVPECLFEGSRFTIHSFVDGVPLSSVCENGKPVDALLLRETAQLFARMTQVRGTALPPLPPAWPRNHTDSQSFLRTLASTADLQIRQANAAAYGWLFAALGIPEDTLLRFAERVPWMARRPYGLLHGDLHRDNLIVSPDGGPPLACVDWELATFGDPLHDLAVHLVRMDYPAQQWDEVVDAWVVAVRAVRPAATHGVTKDLGHYVDFERAQSVYPDVMRAAKSLEESFDEQNLRSATASIGRALEAAAEPLRLRTVPGEREIEHVLFRWAVSASAKGAARRGRIDEVMQWRQDRRVPEHPDFPHSAVSAALSLEGTAPARHVFKGTAHLNSVIRVPGIDFPVVIRRKVPHACRRERSYLSEHAVLRAIERSGAAVAAPRVLALGESHSRHHPAYSRDRFAIHTYEGPGGDTERKPDHPVHGLRPQEADGLVDQLAALTGVDHTQLDPASGEPDFYHWLSEQLVALVAGLPKESQQLARIVGLPDAVRLRQILTRHRVSRRAPALLHGDLNPWNLVRRDDGLVLTLIDWEMALVGDPLYDLVRHMHLTPTRPEIRDRMFRRWVRRLEPEFTHAWQQDWRVYRWIEIVRSAYVDLDRLVTGASVDAPNVRRALDSYAMTLAAAKGSLGLPGRATANHILLAL